MEEVCQFEASTTYFCTSFRRLLRLSRLGLARYQQLLISNSFLPRSGASSQMTTFYYRGRYAQLKYSQRTGGSHCRDIRREEEMVLDRRKVVLFSTASAIRVVLFFGFPALPDLLTGRVEISTPVTSFKRCIYCPGLGLLDANSI